MSQYQIGPVGRTYSEGVLRVLFGVFLAIVAIFLVLWATPKPFAIVTVLMGLFAARPTVI